MRKRKTGRKFSRTKDQRHALLRHLAADLVLHKSIITTEAKAKELRPFVEKLVSRARSSHLADRRYLVRVLSPDAARTLFAEIAPKYLKRPGGYTRIVKLPARQSDAARIAKIEFVE